MAIWTFQMLAFSFYLSFIYSKCQIFFVTPHLTLLYCSKKSDKNFTEENERRLMVFMWAEDHDDHALSPSTAFIQSTSQLDPWFLMLQGLQGYRVYSAGHANLLYYLIISTPPQGFCNVIGSSKVPCNKSLNGIANWDDNTPCS